MTDDPLADLRDLDAYTLADAARRIGTGAVIHDIRPQTSRSVFVGRARTARVQHEPNWRIPLAEYGLARVLDRIGPGDVLVLDGGGVPLTVIGDMAVVCLLRRGAAAAVVNAYVRDVEEIEKLGLPVFARGVGIASIAGRGYITDVDAPVRLDGHEVRTGDLVCGCRGGLVVAPWDQRGALLAEARAIVASDRAVIEGLERGETFQALWDRHKAGLERSRG